MHEGKAVMLVGKVQGRLPRLGKFSLNRPRVVEHRREARRRRIGLFAETVGNPGSKGVERVLSPVSMRPTTTSIESYRIRLCS